MTSPNALTSLLVLSWSGLAYTLLTNTVTVYHNRIQPAGKFSDRPNRVNASRLDSGLILTWKRSGRSPDPFPGGSDPNSMIR
jgi:hypothetical protein